jgi:PHD/YefM family antitoxin component YafN of YafNO toxin-antitoxin module
MNKTTLQSIPRMVSVSDLQRKARKIFEELDDAQPTLVLNRNRAVGVVLNPSVYEELMDELEDRYAGERLDTLVRESKPKDFAPWEELEQKLIKAGKLKSRK